MTLKFPPGPPRPPLNAGPGFVAYDSTLEFMFGSNGLPAIGPPWSQLTAYDLNKGTIAWQIANGDTPANVKSNPKLQGLNIPKTGSPRLVGLMVTKTLLFAGDGTQTAFSADDRNRHNGLIYKMNEKDWKDGKNLDFGRADAVDTALLNQYLWQDRMGDIPMPPGWEQPAEFAFARMMFPGGWNDGGADGHHDGASIETSVLADIHAGQLVTDFEGCLSGRPHRHFVAARHAPVIGT
jgi:hypothetical protein